MCISPSASTTAGTTPDNTLTVFPQLTFTSTVIPMDSFGRGCDDSDVFSYQTSPSLCGFFDDSDFTASHACPACQDAEQVCVNTADVTLDSEGFGCDGYFDDHSHFCGRYDDSDFTAEDMCCTCGGGRGSPPWSLYCQTSATFSCQVEVVICPGVTEVTDHAFSGCDLLSQLHMPGSIERVGDHAFANCTSLKALRMPPSVTEIGASAFSGCTSLTEVRIPEKVVEVGAHAFAECAKMTRVSIGHSLQHAGSGVFQGCCEVSRVTSSSLFDHPSLFDECASVTHVTILAGYASKLMLGSTGCEALVSLTIGADAVPASAWSHCASLSDLHLQEAVTEIGTAAFESCHSLTELVTSNSLTRIGDTAFSSCSALAAVELGSSVSFIGHLAFQRTALAVLELPDAVTEVGDSAFDGCRSLERVTMGASLLHLGDRCFKDCSLLRSVRVGEAVTTIGKSAFEFCAALVDVFISNSVVEIGDSAFESCAALEDLHIGRSVERVGTKAFQDCCGVATIVSRSAPIEGVIDACAEVTNITIAEGGAGKQMLGGECHSLKYLTIDVEHVTNSSWSECESLVDLRMTSKVTQIGDAAFKSCTSLTELDLPNSVHTVGHEAFSQCTSLAKVTLSDSIATLGEGAFSSCASLVAVALPYGIVAVSSRLFSLCTSLVEVHVPDSVTFIGEEAFYGCSSLAELPSMANVAEIGTLAFAECLEVTRVITSDALIYIGEKAFSGCASLEEAVIGDSVNKIFEKGFEQCSRLSKLRLGASLDFFGFTVFKDCCSVKSIVSYVQSLPVPSIFDECARITDVTIAAGYGQKDMFSHDGCGALKHLSILGGDVLPDAWSDCASLVYVGLGQSRSSGSGSPIERQLQTGTASDSPIAVIGENAFGNNSVLQELDLPDSVSIVASGAFQGCTSLTKVTMSRAIEYIGTAAFLGCDSLSNVTIPSPFPQKLDTVFSCSALTSVEFHSGVTHIADEELRGCSSLLSVDMPSTVVDVGDRSFEGCQNLLRVNLGSTVHTIGESAFEGCSNLQHIGLGNSIEVIKPSAFKDCKSLPDTAFPRGLRLIEESAFAGCTSLTSLDLADMSALSIGSRAFHDCTGLSSLFVGEGVSSIGASAFEGCQSLLDVDFLPNATLEKLSDSVFAGCSALENVTVPDSVRDIGDSAFARCHSLQAIVFPNQLFAIGGRAFENCTALERVTLPGSLDDIGDFAFANCSSLTHAIITPPEPRYQGISPFPENVVLSPCDTASGFEAQVSDRKVICACPAGSRFDGRACRPCERHLDCPGGHLQPGPGTDGGVDVNVYVEEGYMTPEDEPFSVYTCLIEESCEGKRRILDESMCKAGRDFTRPRCAACKADYYPSANGGCSECDDPLSVWWFAKAILAFTSQLLLTYRVYVKSNQETGAPTAILESCVPFAQAIQTLLRLDLNYPHVLKQVRNAMAAIAIPNWSKYLEFRLECVFTSGAQFTIWQQAVAPLAVFFNLGLVQLLFWMVGSSLIKDHVWNFVGVFFTGLFLTLVSLSLSLFFKETMPNGKQMVVDFPELVYQSEEWFAVLPVNFFSTLMYGVSTVAYVTYTVWTAPRRVATEPNFLVRNDFLFGSTRPDRWWWCLLKLAFGLSLILCQVMLPGSSVHAQVYTSLISTFSYTMFQMNAGPYLYISNMLVDGAMKFALLTFLIICTSFIDTSREEDLESLNNFWALVLIIVVIAACVYALASLAYEYIAIMHPVAEHSMRATRTIWNIRDIAQAMVLMPEEDFAKRLHDLTDSERGQLQQATKVLINVIFRQQISSKFFSQRLIAEEYRVWDHEAAVKRTLEDIRSGRANEALVRSAKLREDIVAIARAVYEGGQRTSAPRLARLAGRHATMYSNAEAIKQMIKSESNVGSSNQGDSPSEDSVLELNNAPMQSSRRRLEELIRRKTPTALTRESFAGMVSSMQSLTLSSEDASRVFDVLDVDGSEDVTVQELMDMIYALAPSKLVGMLQENAAEADQSELASTDRASASSGDVCLHENNEQAPDIIAI